ncbi:L-glutamine ABC transporter membrane protein /L-glutamate ABC transporter membrane protein /L-aspartate ABC transporter membrane protein /L-asparagine ABC transporter membrane protein [Gemmobacter megaterium]|uniref:L-glutamine ABC transporter membrane protein /L-glutamate ABC transporter membrane protein /L-aspartate ABC transporter membrane protein /L-asparagine ABC transporter membrane protein n=1 Tax=Gemmobacter megaterium TaxID=1086013 RepID=A0A1N7LV22_9RHOB|nr:ABC transporter permease subunit [Gemmobacter megaterium]GGE10459.1 amino acid ABC transporter permease [Gemmobacter megaterium]SIS77697.1 L-glutamine ABC transporter membrane protein /L-glutamate ABC transporter membrane protein /L-aspartate ABC transporter membrane protein /L-asparagine ABC transporter membrane protein [Gemmobacter megaterium]
MATMPDVRKDGFRLSMLIYDTRYRSITLQVIFLGIFVIAAWWLIHNTVENLRALGKDFSFGFLTVRSGYDINQRLIEYSSDSTHARAFLVGLLNTLLVAFLACISATVVGVLAGVLRLSKNWLVARLMTVYVEAFRNIPLLIWILLIFAIMTESMPAPSAFRGENATSSMMLFDSIAVTNRGVYVPEPLFSRSLGNLDLGIFLVSLDLLAIVAVILGSVLANRKLLKTAERIQNDTGVRPVTWWKSILIFLAPLVVLKFALGFHLGLPELRGFNFADGTFLRNSLIALWFALTVYTGAFIAETVRAGIMAVSHGQTEAAAALGLRPGRIMSLVVLPQALRVIIPPMISQYLNITKNTSLALAVGYMDIRSTLGGITINQTGRELEGMLLMMLTYLVISLLISMAMNVYNASVKLKER